MTRWTASCNAYEIHGSSAALSRGCYLRELLDGGVGKRMLIQRFENHKGNGERVRTNEDRLDVLICRLDVAARIRVL